MIDRQPPPVAAYLADGAVSSHSMWLVRALALIWLAFAVYPLMTVIELLRQPTPVVFWVFPVTGLTLMGVIYVWAVLHVASASQRAASWPAIGALSLLALVLPLAFGTTWFGGFLYPCLLAGLTLPRRHLAGAIAIFATLTLAVGAIMRVMWGELLALTLLTALGGLLMYGVMWLLVVNAQLRAARAEIARLAVTEERLRFARDLHDSVKQQVFVTAMEIGSARALVERDPHAAAARLTEASESIHQVQADLSALIHHARTDPHWDPFTGQRFAAGLHTYVGDWSRRSGIPADVRITGDVERMDMMARTACYRVVQEALANVARHSQATAAGVIFDVQDAGWSLCVWDNGCGFTLDSLAITTTSSALGGGYGLHGMRERMEALGGRFTIESTRGQGTCVTCGYGCGAARGAAHTAGEISAEQRP